jgi:hypothetical protein
MDDKINNEISKLNNYEAICNKALDELQKNHPQQLLDFERGKITSLLHRLFEGEREYLMEESEYYFEIYGDED